MFDLNGLIANSAPTGALAIEAVAEFQKALEAGYGTDVATLTGGGALRIQSLDPVMQATIAQYQDFKLFNALAKTRAGATVDEWTEQSDVGGFLGGSTNSEDGIIPDATGNYKRRVGQAKYLMTRRQVTFVATLQNSIVEAQTVEYQAGALQLMRDAEYFCFEGNSAVVTTEFDGIGYQLVQGIATGDVDPANIIDARGAPLNDITYITEAAATISGYGNFGRPTDIYLAQTAQADLDNSLQPAFRVALSNVPNGGVDVGAPVRAVRTSWGDIANQPDVFVRDEKQMTPFEVRYSTVAQTCAGQQPTLGAPTVATNAASLFTASQAGTYYYYVTGVSAQGQSTGVVSAQVAIAAGDGVTLTITASAGSQETGYVIYRSRQNGGNAVSGLPVVGSDFREMAKVPKAGATTTYVDLNTDIPGTTRAYVLNLRAGDTAMTWRQMLPMLKFPLYATNAAIIPWAQMLFGYLRISKRRQHVMIKNIVPTKQTWQPFTATN